MSVRPTPVAPVARSGEANMSRKISRRGRSRPAEKGVENLVAVDNKVAITLMGPLNDGLRCSKGMVPYEQLLQMYRDFSVYFNPSPVIGISVAEALMVGMPVVKGGSDGFARSFASASRSKSSFGPPSVRNFHG